MTETLRISICDVNWGFVVTAAPYFSGMPNVTISQRSAIDQPADAVVSPANSFGFMDGGVDLVYLRHFGEALQTRVQAAITLQPHKELLVGNAIVVPTENDAIPYLIVAPTMRVPKRISDPADIMLATRAAVSTAAIHFRMRHIVMPGMGTGTGGVPPEIAARAMRAGIELGLREASRPMTVREAAERHFDLRG